MADLYRVEWSNVGGWVNARFHPSIGVRTPWGNVIVKRWSDRLFSERYGMHKSHFKLFGLCVSWVRLRHFPDLASAIADVIPQETPLMSYLSALPSPPKDAEK